MNDLTLLHREARARQNRENAAKLASLGITPAEASLFNVIHYGVTVSADNLCYRAAHGDYAVGGPSTEDLTQAALADCFAKGWLQVVDAATLSRIQEELRREGILGPIYGYPSIGGVDFTHAGAEQWYRIVELLWDGGSAKPYRYPDVVHEKSSHYFRSESKAIIGHDLWKHRENVVAVSEPIQIGPWRANWWRRFAMGYRIDVEMRMQWQGQIANREGSVYFNWRDLPFNSEIAADVLNRHSLECNEWLVLAEQDGKHYRIVEDAAEDSDNSDGATRDAEWSRGMEACLRKGWLRRLNEQAIAEIDTLLNSDAAVTPVLPNLKRHWRHIAFTNEGAKLYRMVSAQIFGQEWEDHLDVSVTYYSEEHRYCATEAGLISSDKHSPRTNETPQTTRTVPIGPWCVNWWQRFPSGYRMELTFGDKERPLQHE